MWTRLYLLLLLVRLYFALSPSYIHPDENFQGPEIIAGRIFGFPYHQTWEFTDANPIRSAFSLWPVYGIPMKILQWLLTDTGKEEVPPVIIYYTLRVVMFTLSFVLEDWAIYELVQSPRRRKIATVLVASSYVTWTYQTHTFSNSVETMVVLWTAVLTQRILDTPAYSSLFASTLIGFLGVLGTFNRITFPAFVVVPGLLLLPHFWRKPLSFLAVLLSAFASFVVAQTSDLAFYSRPYNIATFFTALQPIPLSSLRYNLSPSNLALHGTHPSFTHFLANLPLLLAPALPLVALSLPSLLQTIATSPLNLSAAPSSQTLLLLTPFVATFILSLFSHQEPRFLLPCVPLLLSGIQLPRTKRTRQLFVGSWIVFNIALGTLMGIFHQGGVVPMQISLGEQHHSGTSLLQEVRAIYWWRTYSPPIWLFDGANSSPSSSSSFLARSSNTTLTPLPPPPTIDLMGMPYMQMWDLVSSQVPECPASTLFGKSKSAGADIIVAPYSSVELDSWRDDTKKWNFTEVRIEKTHLNLDDLEWGDDGFVGTLRRVVGRRGLVAWRVERRCI
ncbi:alpha 1,2 mannosyltransferase [Agyrium rufum]|nr:alpha 1,2 mannosyltransferase [Agyrium rufum]